MLYAEVSDLILIYNDNGVSTACITDLKYFFDFKKIKYKLVSGSDLQSKNSFSCAKILIVPGGRSLPFYESLGEIGNQNIIDFVRNGGSYFGICAGAYYACHKTIFAKNLPNELILPGALNFFKGNAIGPVFAAEDFAYQSEKGARIVTIAAESNNEEYDLYFNGGCYFDGDAKVIWRYKENNLPAIVSVEFGKGVALLSGVHPELSYRTIVVDENDHNKHLAKNLKLIDARRIIFFENLIQSL